MRSNPDLWKRIEAFSLNDPDARLDFTGRLARDNGWTRDFATRVIGEYKRFCYLACVAGHEVTPSDEVDQAWHLHLAYSRSYWDEFCTKILQQPFHHGPTRGGSKERKRYDVNYIATVESYGREFGAYPPEDIWPHPDIRFGESLMARRVNTAQNWVIPKPRSWPEVLFWMCGFVGAAVVLHDLVEGANYVLRAYLDLLAAAHATSPILAALLVLVTAVITVAAAILGRRVTLNLMRKRAEKRKKQREIDSGGGCTTSGSGDGGGGDGAGGCGGGCGGGGCGG